MQMHEWDKQAVLLDKIESFQLADVLQYNKFAYEKHEWDNIPAIVPRYVIYLAKYMDGICKISDEFNKRETTMDLRSDMENKNKEINSNITKNREQDLDEKKQIDLKISNLDSKTEQFRGTFDKFVEDSSGLNENDCFKYFNQSMEMVLQTRGKQDQDRGEVEDEKMIKLKNNRDQMRMYSFKQLYNIFRTISNQSELHDRLCKAEGNIDEIFKNIKDLRDNNVKMRTYADDQIAAVKSDIKSQRQQLDDVNIEHSLRINTNMEKIKQHREALGNINDSIIKIKEFQDGLKSTLAQTVQKQDSFKNDTLSNQSQIRDDYKERIYDLDKYYSENMEEMSKTIESVRLMARDSVAAKEKEITDLMTKQVKTIQSFVDDNIEDMVEERKATLAKYEKQFNQIKIVCCKYFEKYDVELSGVQLKAQSVMDKYSDWSKVLIEPASLNDARLFSLESRMHEEEEIRIREYEFVRDLLKKLIYSLEKTSVASLDQIIEGIPTSMASKFQQNQGSSDNLRDLGLIGMRNNQTSSNTPQLPNLLNNVSVQNSIKDNSISLLGKANSTINDSMSSINMNNVSQNQKSTQQDVMMLKRLNFLRNSLEQNNPRETTQHLREEAMNKRDERILELWQHDIEKPSVSEIVEKMRKQKEQENMHSSKFNVMLHSIQNGNQSQDQIKYNNYNPSLMDSFDSMNVSNIESAKALNMNHSHIVEYSGGVQSPKTMKTQQQNDNGRWASRPKNVQKNYNKMQASHSLSNNLNRSKFISHQDTEIQVQVAKQAKLKPIKGHGKDKFWNDFHEDIQEKSQKTLQSNAQVSLKQGLSSSTKDDDKTNSYNTIGAFNRPMVIKSKVFGGDRNSQIIQNQGLPMVNNQRGGPQHGLTSAPYFANQNDESIVQQHGIDVQVFPETPIVQTSMTQNIPTAEVSVNKSSSNLIGGSGKVITDPN